MRKYPLTLILCLALLALSLFPVQPIIKHVPLTDKWSHFLAFTVLYVVTFVEVTRSRSSIQTTRWRIDAVLFSLSFGVLIELLQWLIPTGRHAELLDIVADSIGVVLGALLCRFMKFERYYPKFLR